MAYLKSKQIRMWLRGIGMGDLWNVKWASRCAKNDADEKANY